VAIIVLPRRSAGWKHGTPRSPAAPTWPLAAGLDLFYAFDEQFTIGSGSLSAGVAKITDYRYGGLDINAKVNFLRQTAVWNGSPMGMGVRKNFLLSSSTYALPQSAGTVWAMTRQFVVANSSTIRPVFVHTPNGSNFFNVEPYSDNNLYAGWFTAGSDHRIAYALHATDWAAGDMVDFAVTWNTAKTPHTRLFIKGKNVASNSSGTLTTFSNSIALSLLKDQTNGDTNDNATLLAFGIWTYDLSTAAIMDLHRDPFMWRVAIPSPPLTRARVGTPGAAGGTVFAAAARSQNPRHKFAL
jgi:hypothetical protein